MFPTQSDKCIPICPFFDTTSLFAAELEEPKVGISVKHLITQSLVFPTIARKPFENIFGKRKNADKQHFFFSYKPIPCSSVDIIRNLGTGSCLFDPGLGQYCLFD